MLVQAAEQLTGKNDLNNPHKGQVSQFYTCDLNSPLNVNGLSLLLLLCVLYKKAPGPNHA